MYYVFYFPFSKIFLKVYTYLIALFCVTADNITQDGWKGVDKNMREKLQRFMMGRYGNDRFNQFLMIVALVCLVISFFGANAFYTIALLIMIYAYYRMFSRQIYKRSAENQKYLQKEMQVRGFLQKKKREFTQLKDYHIYRCPGCKQKIRVPRGRGKIAIRCRKCGNEFIKKS